MKLSARERTALRAMVEFAGCYGEGPTALSEVARRQELPLPYLEQVAGALRRAGLLESARGAHGGYCLAAAPQEISIGDIIRAVEGELVPLECLRADHDGCSREAHCITRNIWELVSERLSETLDHITLADVLR
jgi:Rrf2 family protein